jgi:gamma-glutamyltranspeptidase/glutathione hydrolase
MIRKSLAFFVLTVTAIAQQPRMQQFQQLRQAVRGTRGAVAAGSEYATEAGMRMYYHGGNAVDVGVSAMFAASVTELSHFGMGGEAPILIRT